MLFHACDTLSRPRGIQRRLADTSDYNHSLVGKRASSCVYNFCTHALWLPGRSPTGSQKATNRNVESHQCTPHATSCTKRNLLQEPGYNQLRNKREPTSSNLTCRFQNYPIIPDHVPDLSDITFLLSAIQASSTEVHACRLIGTCAESTQNY